MFVLLVNFGGGLEWREVAEETVFSNIKCSFLAINNAFFKN